MSFRKKLTISIASIVACALIALVIHQLSPLLSGPRITIESPTNGESYKEAFHEVSGTTQRAAQMTINQNPVRLRDDGTFVFPTVFVDGINTLTIIAEDKFGRTDTVELVVFKKN
ncbi:hypothetical protein H6776_00010 [Candidatus Nomurabacteria bacterium]|nr:hypothetical protein [Candidatus Nomurabacteria bacterium]